MIQTSDRFRILFRCQRNRCPRCGEGRLMTGLFKLVEACPNCHFKLDRGEGFFLGALPINYFVIVVYWMLPIMALWIFAKVLSYQVALTLIGIGMVVGPIFLYTYSKLLWLGTYYFWLAHELEEKPSEA